MSKVVSSKTEDRGEMNWSGRYKTTTVTDDGKVGVGYSESQPHSVANSIKDADSKK